MSAFAHVFHLILTIIFFPWLIVWVACTVSASNKHKRLEDKRRDEELQLLREIAGRSKK